MYSVLASTSLAALCAREHRQRAANEKNHERGNHDWRQARFEKPEDRPDEERQNRQARQVLEVVRDERVAEGKTLTKPSAGRAPCRTSKQRGERCPRPGANPPQQGQDGEHREGEEILPPTACRQDSSADRRTRRCRRPHQLPEVERDGSSGHQAAFDEAQLETRRRSRRQTCARRATSRIPMARAKHEEGEEGLRRRAARSTRPRCSQTSTRMTAGSVAVTLLVSSARTKKTSASGTGAPSVACRRTAGKKRRAERDRKPESVFLSSVIQATDSA